MAPATTTTTTTNQDPIAAQRVADAVEGAEPTGTIGVADAARTLATAAGHARGLTTRGLRLGAESMRILAGRSQVQPDRGDWRFRDEAWTGNPAYHRLMQLYLAWTHTLRDALDDANLEWREAERARFYLEILLTAAAPSNALMGNPAALKRVLDTGGTSLLSGARNFVHDVLKNRGMPSQTVPGQFEVGRNLAATPGAVVYREDVCEVIQYQPTTSEVRQRPVLMVPPQIGRYYFMDLAPGRSFTEHAVGHGLPYFTISWRNPQREQGDWTFDTYAAALDRVVDVVREISRSDDVNVLSLCAGGILTSSLLSHMARSGDRRINTASFGVTLLDFDVQAPIGAFDAGPLLSLARERSARSGILKSTDLGPVFTWMRPNDLVWNYWVNNYLLGKEPPRFDILAWNAHGTNLPAALHRQFLDIFRHNAVVRGELEVLGSPVDLARIDVETYVTGATTDHLTPWKGCYRTTQLLGGPSTFVLSNAGHIASLINPPGNPKAHYFAGPEPGGDPDQWRARADRRAGTWWEHWAEWVTARAGEERRAPTRLGSRRHPVIEPAPGSYVRG